VRSPPTASQRASASAEFIPTYRPK
jgi:hypothetical protein